MSRLKTAGKLFFFLGIPLLPLLVFWFIPMIVSIWLSLTNWDYISPSFDYVGIDNYTSAFTSEDFYQALYNTIFFGFWTVIPTVVIGLLLALLLRETLKGITFFRSLLFSPWITPMVAMSIVWTWIYEPEIGLLNQILGWFNLPQPEWLMSSDTAMWAVIIVTIWKNAGWAMLFYSDSLTKIPKELYEVSDIVGSSWFQKLRTIVIPLVSPTTLFLVIMSTIESIKAYDQIQVMTQGGPAGATRTLLYLYYQMAFEQFDMGQATAIANIIVVLTGILALSMFYVSKRWTHY
ncbi:sugar ABC transporter permease [Bacillus sp. J14TS2]|uniref:carbohydrate ABC transporter permease n=1 Tax=unclassified Bacillus (in: firmicutes) TaxID=185979 RepID=UPI001A9677A3|nr:MULTISPECIES: sugar ABC transporter permease [unclassified Bacillus (in: firmicutes)]MBO0993290.1 sugar ABC transporter permease [Bacillus sp. SD088]GIN72518.1 sugar ABC transporter permease [Bacillus sp. J14TS2]